MTYDSVLILILAGRPVHDKLAGSWVEQEVRGPVGPTVFVYSFFH